MAIAETPSIPERARGPPCCDFHYLCACPSWFVTVMWFEVCWFTVRLISYPPVFLAPFFFFGGWVAVVLCCFVH